MNSVTLLQKYASLQQRLQALLTGKVVACFISSLKYSFHCKVLVLVHVSILYPFSFPPKDNHCGDFHKAGSHLQHIANFFIVPRQLENTGGIRTRAASSPSFGEALVSWAL